LFTRETGFFRPWVIGASVWLVLSLIVSLEHLRTPPPHYLVEFSGLMSLLWMQFGFAGLFHSLRKERGRQIVPFLVIIFLPPAILFLINLYLGWRLSGLPAVP
jgi:hypothetical protein